MDQDEAPMLDGVGPGRRRHRTGFGAPGHHLGRGAPPDVRRALGRRLFAADLTTPKGLDDRAESGQTVQRAHDLGAEAWGAEMCRYTNGGSTQSLHMLLAAVLKPGDTVAMAANAHEAAWSAAIFAGYRVVPVRPVHDPLWDVEHGVEPGALAAVLDANPEAKAALVVSPSYFGVTSDIPGLADVAHARGLPLIVDAAWGAAFPFSDALPANPLDQGADAMAVSVHKTMGCLGGGSAVLKRGRLVDSERFKLAYELFVTTSPSVPVLGSVDGARREHARRGRAMWADAVAMADDLRARLRRVDGVRVMGEGLVGRPGVADLDRTKVTLDVSGLGVSGYAADDWLVTAREVSVGLSDARLLNLVIGPGVAERDLKRMAGGVEALAAFARADPGKLKPPPPSAPPLSELSVELAMTPADAFATQTERVPWEEAAGRIAAEVVAPAPPGIARLVPGQRVTEAHVRWLTQNREAGMFVLDPSDPEQRVMRVVA